MRDTKRRMARRLPCRFSFGSILLHTLTNVVIRHEISARDGNGALRTGKPAISWTRTFLIVEEGCLAVSRDRQIIRSGPRGEPGTAFVDLSTSSLQQLLL